MIARSPRLKQQPRWQEELRDAVTRPAELWALLELDPALLPAATFSAQSFRLKVPRGFVAQMRRGDLRDPLLLQVMPAAAEQQIEPGYTTDPVGDLDVMPTPGLLRKYQGRALLITSPACAVNCRYCFRRHFPYAEARDLEPQFQAALTAIAGDTSITEVILSGGDPLLLPDERLAALAAALDAIPHVRRLRVHTRLPVVLPARVDTQLLDWLTHGRLKPVVVLHSNHANELASAQLEACGRLKGAGITLLNQSVLLAGINDDADVLMRLSERLFEAGVLPYYLHALDRVQGSAHFEVPQPRALELIETLRFRLPGYLVPRLVREVAGQPYKLPLT